VKKEDLKASFDQIKPSESEKTRMLNNILNHSDEKKGISMLSFNFKKAVPALVLTVVIAGGILTYKMMNKNYNYNSTPDYDVTDNMDLGREDSAAPLTNQFQIDDKHYILLSDDLKENYGFPADVKESDIGEKIANITRSPDKSMIGSEVYKYIPAGGEAVVAVKKDNEYRLFCFYVFESYNNNQDEDAVRYLALYGINKADDIAKIQFISHSDQSKLQGGTDNKVEITDRDEIARFYSFYSALKNSSDKYFDRLFNFSGSDSGKKGAETDTEAPDTAAPDNAVLPDEAEPDMTAPNQTGYGDDAPMNTTSARAHIAEDLPLAITNEEKIGAVSGDTTTANDTPVAASPSGGIMDMGDKVSGSGETEPSQGSAVGALANAVTIRIYNQNGVYYESVYYINLGFIGRYEVSKDFADFIGKYLR